MEFKIFFKINFDATEDKIKLKNKRELQMGTELKATFICLPKFPFGCKALVLIFVLVSWVFYLHIER